MRYEYRLNVIYAFSNLAKSVAKRALGFARIDKYRRIANPHESAVSARARVKHINFKFFHNSNRVSAKNSSKEWNNEKHYCLNDKGKHNCKNKNEQPL